MVFCHDCIREPQDQVKNCTHHSGLKLTGALMSHSSFISSFRLSVRVLLHGLWQNDTKSAGHWYLVVFLAVDARNEGIIISTLIQQHLLEIHITDIYGVTVATVRSLINYCLNDTIFFLNIH